MQLLTCSINISAGKTVLSFYLFLFVCLFTLGGTMPTCRGARQRTCWWGFLVTVLSWSGSELNPTPLPFHSGNSSPLVHEVMIVWVIKNPKDLLNVSHLGFFLFTFLNRAEGKIKHCRVQQDGQTLMLGTSEFDSLVDLISYYEHQFLYRKMKLRYPINEDTLEKIGTAVSTTLLLTPWLSEEK